MFHAGEVADRCHLLWVWVKLSVRVPVVQFTSVLQLTVHLLLKFTLLVKTHCWKMKNPHPLSDTWNRSMNKDPVLVTVAGTNKKFKRKSREPKRLLSGPEPEMMKTHPADLSDVDSVDDPQMEASDAGRLAPRQRQLMMSQEVTVKATGTLSGLPEATMAPAQSGAIDMRIGINVPTITSKLSQFPEISHWPTAISQPLSNRLKLGLCSTFPLSTSSSSSHSHSHSHSPSHQTFSLEPPLSDQAAALPLPRTSQTPQCHEHMELQVQSPKVNMSIHMFEMYCSLAVYPCQRLKLFMVSGNQEHEQHSLTTSYQYL